MAIIHPKIAVRLGKKDLTASLAIKSITYTDYESENIDTLSLSLAPTAKLPNFGDRLELFLGYENYYFMGAFYVSKIKESYKKGYTVEALSIDYSKPFKMKKSRSFKMSYADALRHIARENNLKTKLNFKRADEVTIIEQASESDAALCARLAVDLDCTMSVKNDTLIFIDKNKTFDRRIYNIDADMCESLEIDHEQAKRYRSCVVYWQDLKSGEDKHARAGHGEPSVRRTLLKTINSDSEALKIAELELQKANARTFNGSLSAAGQVLWAGGYLNLQKGRQLYKKLLITQVTHTIDANSWRMNLKFN